MGAKFSKFRNRVTKSITARFRKQREPPPVEQPQLSRRTRHLTSASLNRIAAERRRRKAAETKEKNNSLRPITLKRINNRKHLGKTPLRHSSLVPNSALTLEEQRNRQKNKNRREKEEKELSQQNALYRKRRAKEEEEFAKALDELAAEFF